MKKLGVLIGDIISRESEINDKGEIIKKNNYIENTQDEYIKSIFTPAGNILNIFEQLEFIPVFIAEFPNSNYYNENGINHPKYMQYHIENHYMKISTIFDLSVILISEIYRLGIPPKLTSYRLLIENKHTKESKSVKIIKKFEKGIQGIKVVRNLITHRGEFDDIELNKAQQYYFLSDKKTFSKPMFSENVLDYHMKKIIEKKLDLVINNNSQILKIIEELFTESLNQLEIKLKEK